MSVVVLPANAVDKSVEWSVDDAAIATIDAAGLLTALKSGTVTVTAKAKDASGVTGTKKIVISGQEAPFMATVWKLTSIAGVAANACEKNTSLVFTETATGKEFTKITHENPNGVCTTRTQNNIPYTVNADGSILVLTYTGTFIITGSELKFTMMGQTDIYIAE